MKEGKNGVAAADERVENEELMKDEDDFLGLEVRLPQQFRQWRAWLVINWDEDEHLSHDVVEEILL